MNKIFLVLILILSVKKLQAQTQTNKDSIAQKLEEITIVKEIQTFTTKNGAIKGDVANTFLNAVPNAIDLLAKIPTVQISPDKESISITGKGSALIYIDKQKVSIDDLNNLAVDDIKTIEIIRNPSSKYESEGRSVILITRKSAKKNGFKASFTQNSSFKKYFNNYFGANSNFKKDKLEFKFNANYHNLVQWESNANDFSIPAQNISSDYLVTAKTPRKRYIFGGGIFYKINDDDYLSFSISHRYQGDKDDLSSDSRYRQNTVYDEIVSKNNSDEDRNFLTSFVNYNTKFKNGIQVFSGFQFSDLDNDSQNVIFNNSNQSGNQLAQNRHQRFNINVASARFDIEKTFKNALKIEVGGLFLSARAKTNLDVLDFENSLEQANSYLQKEKNISAYMQLSGNYKKLSYSAGLRLEKTIIDGGYSDSQISLQKNYTDLFPKTALNYAVDSTKTLTFNYAKSISRPDYSSTNLNPTYINPYFVFSGNINLNPSITDELTLGYQQKENYFGLTLYQTKNPSYYGFEHDSTQNILIFKPINFDKETGLNLITTIPFKYKFWSSSNTLCGILNKIEDKNAVINDSKPYLYYFSDHTFKLPRNFVFTMTGWGMTKRNEGVFDKNAYFITNLALVKNLGTNWILTISGNDIFHQMNFTEKFTVAGIHSNVNYFIDTREFAIAIKYSFGKIKDSSYKEKEIDENANRIK